MTPPHTDSASKPSQRHEVATVTTLPRTGLPLAGADWAGRYDAIDLLAARLHDHQCEGGCSDTHWMAWTGPALAALDGAHVHTHHHSTGRRLVIELDLPPAPGDPSDTGGAGGWCA